jgi:hypothetical protein
VKSSFQTPRLEIYFVTSNYSKETTYGTAKNYKKESFAKLGFRLVRKLVEVTRKAHAKENTKFCPLFSEKRQTGRILCFAVKNE